MPAFNCMVVNLCKSVTISQARANAVTVAAAWLMTEESSLGFADLRLNCTCANLPGDVARRCAESQVCNNDCPALQVLNGKSDSFQMVKSQQQVSANQGRLDAFMTQSQPTTAAQTVVPSATAALTVSISALDATAPHAATAVAAPGPAAAPAGHGSKRPSWVKAVPDHRSRGTAAPGNPARPRDITNLPLAVGSSPTRGQAKQPMPNTISPGKQTRM